MKIPAIAFASFFAAGLAFTPAAEPPKLVVAILVDQLRYDYLDRFHDQFPKGGFRLLTEQGAFMTFAQYNYAPTVTGPGHASFLSGAPPSVHGIIQNDWFDKRTRQEAQLRRRSRCAGRRRRSRAPASARRAISSARISPTKCGCATSSKVVGVAIKDRGAILPAGKKPAGAYWFDSTSGNFITSTYYMAGVAGVGKRLQCPQTTGLLRRQDLVASARRRERYHWPDDAAGEAVLPGEKTATFDHVVHPSPTEGFENVVITPFGNQLLAEFAWRRSTARSSAPVRSPTCSASRFPPPICAGIGSARTRRKCRT